jgi:hypothetical protein
MLLSFYETQLESWFWFAMLCETKNEMKTHSEIDV